MAVWMVACLAAAASGAAGANPLLDQLTETGAPPAPGASVRIVLPPPTMPDGLDAAAQRNVLDAVADARYRVDQLLRRSAVAPFVFRLSDQPLDEPHGVVRRADVWCVAYGDWGQLTGEGLSRLLLEAGGAAGKTAFPVPAGLLSEDALRRRGFFGPPPAGVEERYWHGAVDLLQRIHVRTTRRIVLAAGAESAIAASQIDERFTEDEHYPNQWRRIERGASGETTLGPPHPYIGSAAYMKLTKLREPQGALFVELHSWFFEPHAWFEGAGLLKAKMPPAIQRQVRELRRRLAERPASGR